MSWRSVRLTFAAAAMPVTSAAQMKKARRRHHQQQAQKGGEQRAARGVGDHGVIDDVRDQRSLGDQQQAIGETGADTQHDLPSRDACLGFQPACSPRLARLGRFLLVCRCLVGASMVRRRRLRGRCDPCGFEAVSHCD